MTAALPWACASTPGRPGYASVVAGARKEREEQFVQQTHWGHYALSYDLTVCAGRMLAAALHDRRRGVHKLANTHYTPCAIGAITMVATAFDCFLNEVCDFQRNRALIAKPTAVERFTGLLPT